MKSVMRFLVVSAMVISGVFSASAQTFVQRSVEGEGVFILPEIQTVLTSARDTVTVVEVLPKDLRPGGYAEVELMQKDQILMLNARRVKSVKEFEERYGAVKVGDEVKLGIRRKAELLIAAFKKIDPEKMPKGRKVMISLGGDGADDIRPWMGTGLILGLSEKRIKVMDKIEGHTEVLGSADIQKNDIIESINGKKLEGLDRLFEVYDKLAVGDKVEVSYSRGDKRMQLSFSKPEARGRMILRNN
ncbi:MAG TPA: PDZ domain-containing protein [bacterium]